MSLKCPKCESEFPKTQRNTIPYAICDWGSAGKLFPPGTRLDANMFCVNCDTNFVATKESYRKLLLTSNILSALTLAIIAALFYAGVLPNSYFIGVLALFFISRVMIPRLVHAYVTVLEEAPNKDVSKIFS